MSNTVILTLPMLCRLVLMELSRTPGLEIIDMPFPAASPLPVEYLGVSFTRDVETGYSLRCIRRYSTEHGEVLQFVDFEAMINGQKVNQNIDLPPECADIHWYLREIARPVAERLISKAPSARVAA